MLQTTSAHTVLLNKQPTGIISVPPMKNEPYELDVASQT
jgi:hypothetical protein